MATEYKLSYTANEINEKLGKIDNLESAISNISSNTIIDVISLPTENINEGVFYRLTTAKFVSNFYTYVDGWKCHYVNELPEVGEPVTSDMINITGYYNAQDNEVYGYADSMVSAAGEIPVGWYPIGVLGQAFDVTWGGIITDVDRVDNTAKVLLSQDYYMYQDGWCKLAMGYEKVPEFDITWDGVVGDKFALDMSPLGYPNGTYFVKVSDKVLSVESVVGATVTQDGGYYHVLSEDDLDTTTFSGAFTMGNCAVCVYSANDLNNALGLPEGYMTNGIYFAYVVDVDYTNRLVAPSKVVKIDEKFLPEMNVDLDSLHTVAKSGNYNDLNNKPTIYTDVVRYNTTQALSLTNKSIVRFNIDVYSKSEVDTKIANFDGGITESQVETMISNAIGSAIGGSY